MEKKANENQLNGKIIVEQRNERRSARRAHYRIAVIENHKEREQTFGLGFDGGINRKHLEKQPAKLFEVKNGFW